MYWHIGNIFDARNAGRVYAADGTPLTVELYVDGWSIGDKRGMDVYEACYMLNSHRCALPHEPRAAPPKSKKAKQE